MRLADLFRFGIKYAVVGGVAAVFALIAFLVGYKIVYRKCMHGIKTIGKGKALWLILTVMYGVMLLGATFFSRGSFYSGAQIVPPLASYREAWYQGGLSDFRNIIVNILLFVPFGFLVPAGMKCMRPVWKTYLAGFVATFIIECLQLLTRRGIFEFDDIINNLVGTMIGHGVFLLVDWAARKENRVKRLPGTLACQLPLLLCIVIVAIVCLAYQKQELGNLAIHYVTKVPQSKYEIVSNPVFDTQERKAFVYQVKEYSLSEARELADRILHNSGTEVHDDETDIYDNTVFYRGTGKHISIEYKGGLYRYTNFDSSFSGGRLKEKADGTWEEILMALNELGVEVPEGVSFVNRGQGHYSLVADAIEKDGVVYDGQINCTLMDDDSIAQIDNKIYACAAYKEFDILSEEEAFQKIQKGEFQLYYDGKAIIHIRNVSLGYMLDSKSFYQPVYLFDAIVDGNEYSIPIPAVK